MNYLLLKFVEPAINCCVSLLEFAGLLFEFITYFEFNFTDYAVQA